MVGKFYYVIDKRSAYQWLIISNDFFNESWTLMVLRRYYVSIFWSFDALG